MTENHADSEELKLAAIEAGKLLVRSQLGAIEKSKTLNCKCLLTPEKIKRIRLPFSKDKEACIAFDTYVSLSNLLVKFYDASQLLAHTALSSFYRVYTVLKQLRENQQGFRRLCEMPLLLTKEEYERLEKKYIAQERKKKISLSDALLQLVEFYIDDYIFDKSMKRPGNPELDKILNSPVTNPRLLSMGRNLDAITEGGNHVGRYGRDSETAEEEFRKNLYNYYGVKDDVVLVQIIRSRVFDALYKLSKDHKSMLTEIGGKYREPRSFRFLSEIMTSMLEWTYIGPKDSGEYIVHNFFWHYCNHIKGDFGKQVIDYILGFSPLVIRYVPHETRFTVENSLSEAKNNYGSGEENFVEFFDSYSNVLDLILKNDGSREMLEQVKKLGPKKAYLTNISKGELSDKYNDFDYCKGIFNITLYRESLINFFKSENPYDPRVICNREENAIIDCSENKVPLRSFRIAKEKHSELMDSLKNLNLRWGTEKILIPSCRYLRMIQRMVEYLAAIYDVYEIKDMRIPTLNRKLNELENLYINTFFYSNVSEKQKLEEQKTLLESFRVVRNEDIKPDDSQIEKILENCKETPFSVEAQATLNKLGDFLQNVSIPEEEPASLV